MPIEIRKRLGVGEGDRVEFIVENGVTILRPARPAVNPFDEYVGCLPAFESVDAINAWFREMRDDE